MMVLITMSLIFSHIRVVLIPLEPRYCHKAFKALKTQKHNVLELVNTEFHLYKHFLPLYFTAAF